MSSSSKDTAAMSLEEYANFLYIPFEEIESAFNNFADENLLTQGSCFTVYKGQLLQSGNLINAVARKCRQASLLLNELMISKNLKHKNIASIFMITEKDKDADEGFIINKHEVNESLDKHLRDPMLTWMQKLHICVGVARALNYLHHDSEENHHVIHGNIKSSKVLLDHNWEPKLHGFAFAVRAKKHHLHLISKYKGALQYMDPAYENTGGLTHKSDLFSFGVLLFEVLFGKEASISNNDNWYFARLARSHYEERKLDDLIDLDIRKQMNLQSLNIFAETAYSCLKEKRSQRPNMNQVLSRLERAFELQHQHEHSTTLVELEGKSSNILKGENFDHLKIRLSDVELATNNFSETYCIGSGGYGKVYKAELVNFDSINPLVTGKVKGEPSKKRSTVAIKRIFSREDRQGEQGFFAEIEMLSNCKHPNIVSLIGFCNEGPEMLLVYEYASNGSLDDYLGNIDNMTNLSWAQRIQICLDIAHGLHYLHRSIEGKQSIIHRDIKSANILLDENWVAKIADFGLSKLHRACEQGSTLITNNIAGTDVYLDPEYLNTGKLKTKSDIYSFGVVMFEIMCGKLAYDKTYNEEGLPSLARHCFNEGTLEKLVDPKVREADENFSMLNGGVNQDSLDAFSKIAYQCLAKTQSERPTMGVVIKELQKALNFQKNWKGSLHISLKALKLGTQDFNDCNCIGEGRFWKLYEGKLAYANGYNVILAKRWHATSRQGHNQFLTECEVLLKYKHKNIIGLLGYCNEMNEKIIVYEHTSKGRLDKHLADPSLTWMKRLKICIDVANGLKFLHTGGLEHVDSMIHRDIKSSSILLDGDLSARISNLELSLNTMVYDRAEHVDDNACDSLGYIDPLYEYGGFLTSSSDIYSFGVILLEMLCGRLAWAEGCEDHSQSLGPLSLRHYNEKGNLDEMIFDSIKKQLVPQSLTIFQTVAIQCVKDDNCDRPSTSEVLTQLKKALNFQEDCEIWEPKLPIDYKEIIHMSKAPDICNFTEMKKDLYDMLSKGILLEDGKLWFSLGSNGERNEMISARKFSYENRRSLKWRRVQESRFQKAAKMIDITKLKIRIRITTRFLSPGINYGACLIFKFCDTRKFSSKPMYVNLKYKIGDENLHAYFATWRDDKWMMIELCRFLSYKKDTDFEVLLESFSLYYCGSGAIYVEGIEFRVIETVENEEIEVQQIPKPNSNSEINEQLLWPKQVNNEEIEEVQQILKSNSNSELNSFYEQLLWPKQVKNKEIEEVQQILKSNSNSEIKPFYERLLLWPKQVKNEEIEVQQILKSNSNYEIKPFHEQLLWPNEVYKKKHLMLQAMDVLYDSSYLKHFRRKPSPESRFQVVLELLPQQVFRINYKIQSQMLSQDTEYSCYLVFKLSEKCHGLHCPVKVRNLLRRNNKEADIIYFRSPSPWNLHGINSVPKQREDGWLEVKVWKFNSNHQLKNDCISMNLKLITYEGTMSGLLVDGLEIRSV